MKNKGYDDKLMINVFKNIYIFLEYYLAYS